MIILGCLTSWSGPVAGMLGYSPVRVCCRAGYQRACQQVESASAVLDEAWRGNGASCGTAVPSGDTPEPMIWLRQNILSRFAFFLDFC